MPEPYISTPMASAFSPFITLSTKKLADQNSTIDFFANKGSPTIETLVTFLSLNLYKLSIYHQCYEKGNL